MWLKQSTAATVVLGPFVDATDGATAETGLTISQADIRLSKNGGSFAQTNNATGASHMENGYYSIPLDTTDTNTLGRLVVAVSESGALPVFQTFQVVPANSYDSLIGGSDYLQVDAVQVEGADATDQINAAADQAIADASLATAAALATVDGVADGIKAVTDNLPDAGALTSLAQAAALATVDANVDAILVDTGTTLPALIGTPAGADIAADIAAVKSDTAAVLVDTGTSGVVVASFGPDSITAASLKADAVAEIADAIWDEPRAGHTTAGTFGEGVASVQGPVTGSVGSVAGNVTGTIGGFTASAKAEINAELVDVWSTDTMAEPSAAPAWPMTRSTALAWVAALAFNKVTQTAAAQTLRTAADDADIAAAATADDGTTFSRGTFA